MSSVTATVESEYSPETAGAVSSSLEVDNRSSPEVEIRTQCSGNLVITEVRGESLEKVLPVLDDLLFCQSVCERVLSAVDRGEPEGSEELRNIELDPPSGKRGAE